MPKLNFSASISAICTPFGSVLSGFLTEPLGRKRALLIVNVPSLLGWIILYYANNITMIYFSFGLLGFAIGLMEASIFTYIGEIW